MPTPCSCIMFLLQMEHAVPQIMAAIKTNNSSMPHFFATLPLPPPLILMLVVV